MWDEARAREEGKEAENNANLVQHNILEGKQRKHRKTNKCAKLKNGEPESWLLPVQRKLNKLLV